MSVLVQTQQSTQTFTTNLLLELPTSPNRLRRRPGEGGSGVSGTKGTTTVVMSTEGCNGNTINSTNTSSLSGPDRKAISNNNNTIEVPEYIVDPVSRTTYLKGKFLGKGGFARVHELTDLTTNRVYAGKIIPKSRLTKPHQKEKILREIDLHRPLRHKNVVRFHHFFGDEENVYIILEYCPRKSLVHVLKNRKVLTEAEVRYFMHQLAEGVKYTHSQGVIHRDLKLGNMFLCEDMEMKIGDFGLATRVGTEGCKKVTICGTPNYIAPEVLNMKGHGFEADVWAMGCIMYAMLVGHPPFETATLNETYNRITNNVYTIPSHVSEPAQGLIMSMLKANPSERPTLSDILSHEFFSTGYMPKELPPSCCSTSPKFPAANIVIRSSPSTETAVKAVNTVLSQEINKVANCVSTLQVHTQTKIEGNRTVLKVENSPSVKKEIPKKDHGFPSVLKQKLTSVLCPDKGKKPKGCTTLALYHMLLSCLEEAPDDATNNPTPLQSVTMPFVTKWIDYSNKYGFGFQLSDHSVGVLFNDTTRFSLSSDRTKVEYHDVSGKLSVYTVSTVPNFLQERYTLLKYFAQYMDENLTEGGDLLQQQEAMRRKNCIPFMKRWVRTAHAIVMQLSCSTLQVNFFKDHTKIVINGERPEGMLMYINEDRHTTIYSLDDISKDGCEPGVLSRLQFALSALQEFVEVEGDEI